MEQRFSSLDNFRDLGGLSVAGGKVIAPRRLLRSGDLSKLTEEDTTLLRKEYNLINVVDLRTEHERLEAPDRKIPDTRYFSLDFFPGDGLEKSTGSKEQLKNMQSEEQIYKIMTELYASYITDKSVKKKLYDFLQLLLQTENGSTLFHCYAGKDRTGITAAVTLTVLGVSKEAIIEDYLESNILRRKVNEAIICSLKEAGMPESMQKAVNAALCVKQQYLEISFEAADTEYGSFDKYISEGIGFEEHEWEKLRKMYLI